MPFTQDELLARLRDAGVAFTVHSHPAVMTVEEGEAALAGTGAGTMLKNLFLKDKKNRLYIITALPDTKVDLLVISSRLGMGKGGLRFAPEEALQEVLCVPPGSVTPLAVANPEAARVVLLLDHHIQAAASVVVHPLVNTASLALTPTALEAALQAVGRAAVFVDLAADPKIDRENPPDLACHVVAPEAKPEGAATGAAGAAASTSTAGAPAAAAAAAAGGSGATGGASSSGSNQPAGPMAGASKAAPKQGAKQASSSKGSAASAAPAISEYEQQQGLTDVGQCTEQLLQLVSQALTGKGLTAACEGLDPYVLRRLHADVESQLSNLKNTSYAMGFTAGKGAVVAYATRQFA